jgi:hypothetical protein
MTEISSSASYVRNARILSQHQNKQAVLSSIREHTALESPEASARVWELLETPQTVVTICRVLENEFDAREPECRTGVEALLGELMREDLVQLSPDS